MFDSFFNAIFGKLIQWDPLGGLIVICLVLTFIVTLIYKFTTNQTLMKELKVKTKEYQLEMKKFKNDPQKLMEIQKQAMDVNMKYMMQSFKPMLFTLIPVIILFGWLTSVYETTPIRFIGITSWLWIYIIFSMIFSIILKKVMRLA
ncbi:MAG: EMC3/TMCO1 family protein [Candidatus Nanoarchaeia archaeon]|nr:EMC3/TMCO1 family protein [Candidatus Nanoarchaeia archaeon]